MKRILFFVILCVSISYASPQVTIDYTYSDGLGSSQVLCLARGVAGDIWVGMSGGITVINDGNFTTYTTANGLGNNKVNGICIAGSTVYAATEGGLSTFADGAWTNDLVGQPSAVLLSVVKAPNGYLWVGTSSNGVAYNDGTSWHAIAEVDGLNLGRVNAVQYDRQGNIWIGTSQHGVVVVDADGAAVTAFDDATGLPSNLVRDITQLDNGNIAVATSSGVAIYNYLTWSILDTESGLPTNETFAVGEDYAHNLWIGTGKGLVRYDVTTSVSTLYGVDDGLARNYVNCLAVTSSTRDNIVCGCFSGLSIFDGKSTFVNYCRNKQLADNEVNTVFVDNNDILWVGTANGLNCVDGQSWQTFTTDNFLTNNYITAIHQAVDDTLWVGTTNGLNYLKGDLFVPITTAHGLSDAVVNSITSDDNGRIYAATNMGISVIVNGVVVDTLTVADGLAADTVNDVHFENGRLWILTDAAIQVYNGTTFTDMSAANCTETAAVFSGKCVDTQSGICYFGSDHSLRRFDNGSADNACISHPYPEVALNAITQVGTDIYCVFANGKVQKYDGSTWSELADIDDATYIAASHDYLWIATQSGLKQVCTTCTLTDIAVDKTSPTCPDVSDGKIVINETAATYSIDGGSTSQASNTFDNLGGGNYHLVLRNDAGELIGMAYEHLDFHPAQNRATLTVWQNRCFGDDEAEIDLNCDNSATFKWENDNSELRQRSQLAPGDYSVTVTYADNCTTALSNTIANPTELVVNQTVTHVTCFGSNDGHIELQIEGGMPPYSVVWGSGATATTLHDLAGGQYEYTVTDHNNCSVSRQIDLVEPAQLVVNETVTNLRCHGDNSGGVHLSVEGGTTPYSISWEDATYANAEHDLVAAAAGTYALTVSDDHNCSATATYEITEPQLLSIASANIVDIRCFGDSTGSVTLGISGGTTPYQYAWQTADGTSLDNTSNAVTNLKSDTYAVTITDGHNCSVAASYEVAQPPELRTTVTATDVTCDGLADGTLTAEVEGGSGTISSFHWHNAANQVIGINSSIAGLAGGDYYIAVADSYDCRDTVFATVEPAVVHDYQLVLTAMTCNGADDAKISVVAEADAGELHYSWGDAVAADTAVATGLAAGRYSVVVTDANGCERTLDTVVEAPQPADMGVLPDVLRLCAGSDSTFTLDGYASQLWSTGDTAHAITVVADSTYSVETVDQQGCHAVDTMIVESVVPFAGERLGLATVTDSNQVALMWAKTPDVGIITYNVYRDSAGNDVLVRALPFDQPAAFVDTLTDAGRYPYRYKIAVVDTCGNESPMSPPHRYCMLAYTLDANSVCYLNWSAYQGIDIDYYVIMRGTSPDDLRPVDSVLNRYNFVSQIEPSGSYFRIAAKLHTPFVAADGTTYNVSLSNIVHCVVPAATTYTIHASARIGGTIRPSGDVLVTAGTDTTFTITANDNYQITALLVDNQDALAEMVNNTYTFPNVNADHYIQAVFGPVDSPTSVETPLIDDVIVFPNPFDDEISIDIDMHMAGKVEYAFVDMAGKTVLDGITTMMMKSGRQTLTLQPDIAAGTYILRLNYNDKVHNFKIEKR